jgi:ankyrin repeat protein
MTYELILIAGSSKVTEFLLSKGIAVDIDYGHGTPLYEAAINEQDEIVKILLDHHANVQIRLVFLFLFIPNLNMDR